MRIDTAFEFNFRFDYWTPVINGESVTYQLQQGNVAGLVVGQNGGMAVVSKEPLGIGGQVRNLKDRRNNPVLVLNGIEYPMYVHTSDPQFSPYGELTAWRHLLRREPPRNALDLLETLVEANS